MNLFDLAVRLPLRAALVALATLALPAAAAPVQWTSGSGGNDHWYEFVSTVGTCGLNNGYDCISWSDAVAGAALRSHLGMQGYLATETSAAEANFVRDHVTPFAARAWLGGSDEGQDGTWTWRTGPEAGQVFTKVNEQHQVYECDPCQWSTFSGIARDSLANYLLTNATPSGGDWRIGTESGLYLGQQYGLSIQGYVVEYSAAAPVPEPETYAMMLAGLGLMTMIARRRRSLTA